MGTHQYPDQLVKKTNKEENTTNFNLENHPFLLCSTDQSQCIGLLNVVLKEFTLEYLSVREVAVLWDFNS